MTIRTVIVSLNKQELDSLGKVIEHFDEEFAGTTSGHYGESAQDTLKKLRAAYREASLSDYQLDQNTKRLKKATAEHAKQRERVLKSYEKEDGR